MAANVLPLLLLPLSQWCVHVHIVHPHRHSRPSTLSSLTSVSPKGKRERKSTSAFFFWIIRGQENERRFDELLYTCCIELLYINFLVHKLPLSLIRNPFPTYAQCTEFNRFPPKRDPPAYQKGRLKNAFLKPKPPSLFSSSSQSRVAMALLLNFGLVCLPLKTPRDLRAASNACNRKGSGKNKTCLRNMCAVAFRMIGTTCPKTQSDSGQFECYCVVLALKMPQNCC